MKIGFDNEKYLKIQSEHIKERISQFDGKLYLELGGKLFDDHHASRVLPGFQPDSKLRMFQKISDSIEIVIVISAADIEKNKIRGDLGITYDLDVLRLIDAFRGIGLLVGSVVMTRYSAQPAADAFCKRRWRTKGWMFPICMCCPALRPLLGCACWTVIGSLTAMTRACWRISTSARRTFPLLRPMI